MNTGFLGLREREDLG